MRHFTPGPPEEKYADAKRILVISDTHGRLKNLEALMARFETPDLTIHCGDLEVPPSMIRHLTRSPLVCVSGNCDFFSRRAFSERKDGEGDEDLRLAEERLIRIGRYTVWITHGNAYGVHGTPMLLKSAARDRGADIVFFGHTHRPYLETGTDLTVANPGSLTFPRQENMRPSFLVMDLDSRGDAHFTQNYL